MILRMLWLACYNSKIDWRIEKDNKISREMWKVVETEAGKTKVAKTEKRRAKRRKGKETRGKRAEEKRKKEEKTKKKKNNGDKEDGKRIGDLGWGRKSNKV